jgi:hypothetical protein
MLTQQPITLEGYLDLPVGPPHAEFEDGTLIQFPLAHSLHQSLLLHMGATLLAHIVANRLGRLWPEIGVRLLNQSRVVMNSSSPQRMKRVDFKAEGAGANT